MNIRLTASFAVAVLLATACASSSQPKPPSATLVSTALLPAETMVPQDPDGYIPIVPPQEGFGPGYVFRGTVEGTTLHVDEIICDNIYPSVKPTADPMSLANASVSDNNSLGMNLSLLAKLIGGNTASLSGKYGGRVDYAVTLKNANNEFIPASSIFPKGTPLPLDPGCHAAIEDLKMKGLFKNSVYVVTDAVILSGLTYKITGSTKADASLAVDIKHLLNVSPTGSHSAKFSDNSIDISTPLTIAVKRPLLVERWVPSGAVAASGASEYLFSAEAAPDIDAITFGGR